MSAPVVAPLNSTGPNRNTIVEVLIGGVYTPVAGVTSFDPTTDNATLQTEGRYQDQGYDRSTKTGTGWSATLACSEASLVSDPSSYDVGQEFLRALGEGKMGDAAVANIRYYEFDPTPGTPRIVAKQGYATVSYKGPGGDATGLKVRTFTFTGQGKLNDLGAGGHPYPNTPAVPVVEAVVPTSASHNAGTPLTIIGAHFTGTTGVTVGGVAATTVNVNDDGHLVIAMGAGSAGAGKAIVVTNATGASSGGATVTLT